MFCAGKCLCRVHPLEKASFELCTSHWSGLTRKKFLQLYHQSEGANVSVANMVLSISAYFKSSFSTS